MKLSHIILILMGSLASHPLYAQKERGYVRKGNQKYIEGKYDDAEKEYNKALEIKNSLPEGVFNLGDVAYKKKDYEKAVRQFETASMVAKDNNLKAKAYHNLGNTYLDAGQYEKSIEAYKNALRLNPNDMDTKYNLAFAQRMLKKNPQQSQQNQNQENKDNQQKQNQQQQANQDKQEQQPQQAQEQQAKEEQAQQQRAQPKEGQLSKEDAQRLLEALMQQEQKVQEKIVNKKMPAERKKVEKDW